MLLTGFPGVTRAKREATHRRVKCELRVKIPEREIVKVCPKPNSPARRGYIVRKARETGLVDASFVGEIFHDYDGHNRVWVFEGWRVEPITDEG